MGRVVPHKVYDSGRDGVGYSNHIGRFGNPEVIHTDQGPAFHNELVQELLRLCAIEQSFATVRRTVSWSVLIKRYCDT